MVDEKKKMKEKSRVVVEGESSRLVESSGGSPDVNVSRVDQFPPDPHIMREAVGRAGDERRRLDDEGTEADDESEIISVGGSLSIVGGCESEGFTFEEAVGRAGLKTRWILLDYRFVSFQASQNPLTFYWDVTLASCSIR